MTQFDVTERYSNGFTCVFNHVRYMVFTTHEPVTHVWTWLDEIDKWDSSSTIPDDAMRHIALELYLVFNIILDGYEYLSPTRRAKARAVEAAMKAYVETRV